MIWLRYLILMSLQVRVAVQYPCSFESDRVGIVLHTIRNRYAQHSIYTYSGIVLIAVNPFQRVTMYGPEIIQAYSGRKRGELEPHLFAIAEDAYTAMRKEGMGQTIIVSGERCVHQFICDNLKFDFMCLVVLERPNR